MGVAAWRPETRDVPELFDMGLGRFGIGGTCDASIGWLIDTIHAVDEGQAFP